MTPPRSLAPIARTLATPLGALSGGWLIVVILAAVLAQILTPYDYDIQNLPQSFRAPDAVHWLGTDEFGRDLLTRILFGARTSLSVAVTSILISVAPVIDPEAAAELHRHAEGDVVTLPVGGKVDPAFGGGPLMLTGRILCLSDGYYRGDGPMLGGLDRSFGPTAVLHVDGIDILVVTENEQMLDRQQLYAFGIDPTRKAVLALKSMQHFRAAFEPIAARVIVCDSGALATPDVRRRTYTHVRRPIWPLDRGMTF